jgi:hypothetical protein
MSYAQIGSVGQMVNNQVGDKVPAPVEVSSRYASQTGSFNRAIMA